MEIRDLIKSRRLNLGYTMKEVAQRVGVSEGTVSRWESGEIENIRRDKLPALAKVLGLEPQMFMGWPDDAIQPPVIFKVSDSEKDLLKKYRTLDTKSVELVNLIVDACARPRLRLYPYYRHIAAAGTGFYFDDIPADTIEAPEMPGADFVIGVSGDSMEPTFSDGDDLYVKKTQAVQFGEVGIFLVEGTCLVKELGASGLVSHNENYETIKGTPEIRCVGKVLGKVER